MSTHNANEVPQKANPSDKASWFTTVIDLASKGISDKSIATRLGVSYEEFLSLLDYEVDGIRPIKQAVDLARAQFEIERVLIKDAILNDPDASINLKYKIVREDLKTLEAWAPATRAVKVTIDTAPSEFTFESFSQDELAQLAAQSTQADSANSSADE